MNRLAECPVCGSHEVSGWLRAWDGHYNNPGRWPLDICGQCAATFLNPMPSEAELGGFYPTEYYSFVEPDVRRSTLQRRLLPIGTRDPKLSVGRFLDIGCGNGWMVRRYQDLGWEAIGVDYSAEAVEAGRSSGLDLRRGSVNELHFEDASFDYVRLNHSFEHMVEPKSTLAEIRRILKPSGHLFIGVPDRMGITARVGKQYWYFLGAPVHTIGYNRTNLEGLLARSGFRVVSSRSNSDHGGVLGTLQMWVSNRRGVAEGASGVAVTEGSLFRSRPLILMAFWVAKLLDRLGQGDCIEIVATPSVGVAA